MPSGIECALQGRLGADGQAKVSQAGKPWLSLRVAVGNGDATQWVSVAMFGEHAHELAGRLVKGREVYIEGRLTLRSWGADGATRWGLDVVAWRIEPLAEIFLNNAKAGSQSDSAAKDSAVVASIALQHNVPLEVIRHALLRDPRGSAASPLGAALDLLAAREGAHAERD